MAETPERRLATMTAARSVLLNLIVDETTFTFGVNDNDPTTVDDYLEDVRTAIDNHFNGEAPLYDAADLPGVHVTRD